MKASAPTGLCITVGLYEFCRRTQFAPTGFIGCRWFVQKQTLLGKAEKFFGSDATKPASQGTPAKRVRFSLFNFSIYLAVRCGNGETKIVCVLSLLKTVTERSSKFVSYGKFFDKRLPVEFTATDSEPDAAVLQLNSTLDSPPNFPLRM